MLLTTALTKSVAGAAYRRKLIYQTKGRKPREEFHMAFIAQDRNIYVFNGRNGTIRRYNSEDQARDDWSIFMERPSRKPLKPFELKPPKD